MLIQYMAATLSSSVYERKTENDNYSLISSRIKVNNRYN